MFRPRLVPILLIQNNALVKSIQFKKHKYIGDPINAARIFNDLRADELAFIDILASKENRTVSLDFVQKVGEETNMPFAVGGGIKTIEDIQTLLAAGAEKVIINSEAVCNPDFVKEATDCFGSSTIAICMDVKKKLFGKPRVWSHGGTKVSKYSPVEFAQLMEKNGAGELFVQSIDKDGTMEGYDLALVASISKSTTIPVVALGGAGTLKDFAAAYHQGYASAIASGSTFVYQSKNRGVLINYPTLEEIQELF